MEILLIILIIFAIIPISVVLALVILSVTSNPRTNNDRVCEQSRKGTKSVLHHNSSRTVEDCMEGAKKTFDKHNLTFDCGKFVRKY